MCIPNDFSTYQGRSTTVADGSMAPQIITPIDPVTFRYKKNAGISFSLYTLLSPDGNNVFPNKTYIMCSILVFGVDAWVSGETPNADGNCGDKRRSID